MAKTNSKNQKPLDDDHISKETEEELKSLFNAIFVDELSQKNEKLENKVNSLSEKADLLSEEINKLGNKVRNNIEEENKDTQDLIDEKFKTIQEENRKRDQNLIEALHSINENHQKSQKLNRILLVINAAISLGILIFLFFNILKNLAN